MSIRRIPSSLFAVVALATLAGCGDTESKPTEKPVAPPASKAPLVTTRQAADWCKEHGVPESICTRCNETLIAGFKEKGDWCASHGVPESQCFACDPSLEAKFKATAPGAGGK